MVFISPCKGRRRGYDGYGICLRWFRHFRVGRCRKLRYFLETLEVPDGLNHGKPVNFGFFADSRDPGDENHH